MQTIQLITGERAVLGSKKFSENEIIAFAKEYDPLIFHIDPVAARSSIFKNLICSGPHPFHHFYKNAWIPLIGNTVVAGLGLDNWRFLKPVYVNQQIDCTVTIRSAERHPDKGTVTVRWYFVFDNPAGELFQHLEMIVLHHNPASHA